MIAHLVDAEDFSTGTPVKLIKIRPSTKNIEDKLFIKALRDSGVRQVRVAFESSNDEMRLVIPQTVLGMLRRPKLVGNK